ncbi:MAG: hypothetical protein AB1505_20365 [Candidatus Latescibacterota bacterium]
MQAHARTGGLLLAALLLAALTSCGNGGPTDSTPSDRDLSGTYALRDVVMEQAGFVATLTPPAVSGTLVLMEDGRFALSLLAPGARVADSLAGTYEVLGAVLTLTDDTPERQSIELAIQDDELVLAASGVNQGQVATLTMTFARSSSSTAPPDLPGGTADGPEGGPGAAGGGTTRR